MGNFNQKRFRELLKKGIGTRTQKEFAAQTGIAAATINRMLNDETIACPRAKTLEIFARNMSNVTLSELMSACGYEIMGIEEAIAKMESDISDFFAFGEGGIHMFSGISEVLHQIETFLNTKFESIKIGNERESAPISMEKKGAENTATVTIGWIYDAYLCKTKFDIYYTLTSKGNLILIGSGIDHVPEEEKRGRFRNTTIQKRASLMKTPEERLLSCIFGDHEEGDYYYLPTTYIGYGFEMNQTPPGFLDFLNAHADTFCDSVENIQLYRRTVEGEDPEAVFAEYTDHGSGKGIGAVIADIIRKETGKEYLYYEKDPKIPEEEQNACILNRCGDFLVRPANKKDLIYLHECVKLLGLPTFGAVYYKTTCLVNKDRIYQTDGFWS